MRNYENIRKGIIKNFRQTFEKSDKEFCDNIREYISDYVDARGFNHTCRLTGIAKITLQRIIQNSDKVSSKKIKDVFKKILKMGAINKG